MSTALERSAAADTRDTRRPRRSTFRGDIEGLRAVAVLAVLVYHLKPSMLPGGFIGVDIFFVISGYLITSHLVREHEATGTISLARFYARRALRLIPAATVVLLTTAVATVLFVPRVLWEQFGRDISASALYVVNWLLAGQSINYLDEGTIASPVQHFWSLAVEEQFYLLWPLVIIIAAAIGLRMRTKGRSSVGIAGAIVIAVSLAFALVAASKGDASAYFTTTTRLWELALGGLAAVVYPWLAGRITRVGRTVLVSLALLALLGSLLFIRDESQWPSALTIVPVCATALIILGGGSEKRSLAERGLSIAPLVWIGGISYSLYLWHWPLISIAHFITPTVSNLELVVIALVSVGLAWLTRNAVENPIRFAPTMRARARNGLILGLACAVVVASVGLVIAAVGPQKILSPPRAATAQGAAVLASDVSKTSLDVLKVNPTWVLPEPMSAPDDLPAPYADHCGQNVTDADLITCTYGDKSADRAIAAIGDSKIEQWFPALDAIASAHHYRLVTYFKSACTFATVPVLVSGKPSASCDKWNSAVLAAIAQLKPAVVLTSQVHTVGVVDGAEENSFVNQTAAMVDGLATMYASLRHSGITIGAIGDNPHPPDDMNMYECVATHSSEPNACNFARLTSDSAAATRTVVARDGGSFVDASSHLTPGADRGLVFVDMSDAICPPQLGKCPAVIGNSLIYRQGSHLTASYVTTLTDRLDAVLSKAGLL